MENSGVEILIGVFMAQMNRNLYLTLISQEMGPPPNWPRQFAAEAVSEGAYG